MAVITVASGLGLSLIGVPLPLVNAMLAGCLTFIPNIGPIVSVIPPALMGLSVGPFTAVGVLMLYFGIQQLEGTVLTPMVMKKNDGDEKTSLFTACFSADSLGDICRLVWIFGPVFSATASDCEPDLV